MIRFPRPVAVFAMLVAGAMLACLLAPSAELRTEHVIDAPALAVWAQISRPEAQQTWNPGIVSMTGPLEQGQRFAMTLDLGGGHAVRLSPMVIRREDASALCWRGTLLFPRLLDGEHCYLLIAEGAATRLVNMERFTGALLWFADVEAYRPAFDAANAALAATLVDPVSVQRNTLP